MVRNRVLGALWLSPVISLTLITVTSAQTSSDEDGRFALAYANQDKTTQTESTSTTTTTTTTVDSERMNPGGPIDMRSSYAMPAGVFEVKNTFGWGTARNGEDDDYLYELELDYGLVDNHQLILVLPVELGDGQVEGNADLTLGWHWQFTAEEGSMPGLGMRNFIRVPSGVHSDGMDYRWVGLVTKTLTDKARLHFNPFFETRCFRDDEDEDEAFDGDWGWNDDEDVAEEGDFVWGGIIGLDYDVCPNVLLVWDYIYRSGDYDGVRDQHSFQVGFDWALAERQTLGFVTNVGLDGDGYGDALGAELSYAIAFGG